jgi:hypothetical protein
LARFPIALPPGLFRDGTALEAKGRWYDASLIRWYGAALGPILGWLRKGVSTLTGTARAAVGWKDNSGNAWIGVGTVSKLYVLNRLGAAFDVTPGGFTVGRTDATASGGYGSGPYGSSTYGTARPDTATTISDATQWTLDTWGEDLLGVSPDDRKIYQWVAPTTASPATQVTDSPDCDAIVVTENRFLFALGTDGTNDDPRSVAWSDQEDNTEWTPSSTNQVGSFPLQTPGRLMCGKRVSGGTLLLTNQDSWIARYIGGVFVHSFDRVGDGCGAISRQCMATFGAGQCVWMSPDINFWQWNGGYTIPLPCDVQDYIRQDINLVQISKVVATVNAQHFEVEFRYCSAASNEIDRCVVWNYRVLTWNIGRASRTCGIDKIGSDLPNPILIASDGKIYDHEVGFEYDDETPYATSGPIELGNGDNIMWVLGCYPDDGGAVGDVSLSFLVRRNADDAGTTFGPYTLSAQTDFRFSGGLIEVTVTGVNMTSWRVGIMKLELEKGEGR